VAKINRSGVPQFKSPAYLAGLFLLVSLDFRLPNAKNTGTSDNGFLGFSDSSRYRNGQKVRNAKFTAFDY
jgi:hypothetical protein